MSLPSWTCPHCLWTSVVPDDAKYRTCPQCMHFCDDATLDIVTAAMRQGLALPCPACRHRGLQLAIIDTPKGRRPVMYCDCGFTRHGERPKP